MAVPFSDEVREHGIGQPADGSQEGFARKENGPEVVHDHEPAGEQLEGCGSHRYTPFIVTLPPAAIPRVSGHVCGLL